MRASEVSGSTDAGWVEAGTSKHHDHVVAHVLGATVVGYFVADGALHLLLDIGFFWIVYADGEMGLVADGTTVAELDVSDETRAAIKEDAEALRSDGAEARGLSVLRAAPPGCLVEEVTLYESGARRKLVISGEEASLAVESSVGNGEITVSKL